MELIFGTSNQHKVEELAPLLPPSVSLLSMKDVGIDEDLPENRDTIQGNAIQKVERLYELLGKNCFSEDTGLCIPFLNGEPGVYSARYAGAQRNNEANIQKVLHRLNGVKGNNRAAYFLTVIACIYKRNLYTFEGKIEGLITTQKLGDKGFGYDPIFQPLGYTTTFANMKKREKNNISHRARATQKLIKFLVSHK